MNIASRFVRTPYGLLDKAAFDRSIADWCSELKAAREKREAMPRRPKPPRDDYDMIDSRRDYELTE